MYVPVTSGTSAGGSCHRLVRRLLAEGATSQWSARPYEPRNKLDARRLERALESGFVHRTDKGTYWVDQERWQACRTKQVRFAIVAVLFMFLVFAILFVLGEFP